jgi:hypothetical protein
MLMRALSVHIAHETAGAARIRHSLRPLTTEGEEFPANLGRNASRKCEGVSIFLRHSGACEARARNPSRGRVGGSMDSGPAPSGASTMRDCASGNDDGGCSAMDCFASLGMTEREEIRGSHQSGGSHSGPDRAAIVRSISAAKWPEIRRLSGFLGRPGLVISYLIRFHCISSDRPPDSLS